MRIPRAGLVAAAGAAAMMLAACGGDGEDFQVEIKRPLAAVYTPLSSVSIQEASALLPGIALDRSQPSEHEILYTVPGGGDFPATIRLQLEPTGSAREGTIVHAHVNVPAVVATIDGQKKVLSERKVESELRMILNRARTSLEMGSSAQAETKALSTLMLGLAIGTNKAVLARVLDARDNPGAMLSWLASFSGEGENQPANIVSGPAGRDAPTVDPDAAQRRGEVAQSEADWEREQAMRQAAAPTSDLSRYDR